MSGVRVLTLADMQEFYAQCEREERLQGEPRPEKIDDAGDDREA